MCGFEIEVVFVKHLFKSDLYFGHIYRYFDNIGSIYKIEPCWHFTNRVLFAPTSYTNMFGSDERLINFWLSLYPMLLFPRSPFKISF